MGRAPHEIAAIARRFADAIEAGSSLDAALDSLLAAAGARATGLWRLDRSSPMKGEERYPESLVLLGFRAVPDMPREVASAFAAATARVPLSRIDLGIVKAAATGSPAAARVEEHGAHAGGLGGSASWLARFGARQSLAAPILRGGRAVGVIAISVAEPFDAESPSWRLIEGLAEALGRFLERFSSPLDGLEGEDHNSRPVRLEKQILKEGSTMARVYNFNPGPAILPLEVLQEAQANIVEYGKTGMSLLEASHRGKDYEAVHTEAIEGLKKLLGLGDEHAVLFLGGGASAQFAMVPMNLLTEGKSADYVNTGAWASKAIKEAKVVGKVNVIAETSKELPARIPAVGSLKFTPGAAYAHITSNETIAGTQWKEFPKTEAPLVADMSSDILSRPFDAKRFALIYAGAQKNLAPAGVTVVIIRKDLASRVNEKIPSIFRYKTHLDENSLYNTPPVFAIYILALVTRWVNKLGGLQGIGRRNTEKAAKLYAAIDGSKFWKGTAEKGSRSDMNVTFRLPSEALEETFVKEASAQGLKGLKGHRSVGGIRASIYNAFPTEGVDALVSFMKEFERKNG
jgi:phosphoserine aminotransferase